MNKHSNEIIYQTINFSVYSYENNFDNHIVDTIQ